MADLARLLTSDVDAPDADAAAAGRSVAEALWAALRTFGRIPDAQVLDVADATLVMSHTPYANFNNVIATSIAEADAHRRVPEVLRSFAPSSLPVTWWVGPATAPATLVGRLQHLGLARQEPEFAMALDLLAGWPATPLAASATLELVERPGQLEEWLGVMNAAYGWPDLRKSAIVLAMYLADLTISPAARDIHHFLVRLKGQAVACSSLFVGRGVAFVTNIGTFPEARGRGLGTAVTGAALELARSMGRSSATLTASVAGRGVYRRLGFTEVGVLERYVATAELVRQLGAVGAREGGT